MTIYTREQRVEAVHWQGEDARYAAEQIIEWVYANGGEASYWAGSGDPHHESPPTIRVRGVNGDWVHVAPGDYVEKTSLTICLHPEYGRPGHECQGTRCFVVRNAAHFREWTAVP